MLRFFIEETKKCYAKIYDYPNVNYPSKLVKSNNKLFPTIPIQNVNYVTKCKYSKITYYVVTSQAKQFKILKSKTSDQKYINGE